jgi:DNA-binding response OmpR family regulator
MPTELRALDLVLVDDHADSREIAAEALRLAGFEVRDFACAEDALEAVTAHRPRAIVTDLSLGEMSGEELARRVRAAWDVPLVAITGHTAAQDNHESLWDLVLIKPVDPFELARRVQALLDERAATAAR